MAATPPPELAQAIQNASSQYGVPPDVLTGIWRVESGSTYPNPYRNSLGYGGLFGTKNWDGSTQSQANTAASILARLIKSNNGNLSTALSQYSGGGYTSVPGQTSKSAPNANPGSDATPDPLGGSQYQTPARPGAQDVGLLSGITSLPGDIWNDGKGILGSAGDTFGALKGFFTAALWLVEPVNWLRGFELVVGSVMLLLGLGYLGKADGDQDVDVGTLLKRGPKNVGSRGARGASSAGRSAARESTTAKVIKTAPKAAAAAVA